MSKREFVLGDLESMQVAGTEESALEHFRRAMHDRLLQKAMEAGYDPLGWREDRLDGLLDHLIEEVRELVDAVEEMDGEQAAIEAVDVANLAMMVADVLNTDTDGGEEAS